jgi:putative transposase
MVASRSQGIVFSFLYWSLRRLVELVVLRFWSEREKEIEILLLRHQLRVLERQVARPQLTQADRALLSAFSRVLPRRAWGSFFVSPARQSLLADRARPPRQNGGYTGRPRGYSSVGRAPGSHPGGRRFESD